MMTPDQKRRFTDILDNYDRAIATINTADENALDVLIRANDLRTTLEGLVESTRHILSNNQIVMTANLRANEQVRILLNDL